MGKSIRNTHKELKKRWETVKKDLKEDSSIEIWNEVYNIFIDRIENRFFKPVELLKNHKDSGEGFGFSMVVILCSLIEFLQSTIDGRFDKKSYGKEFENKYYLLINEERIKFYLDKDDYGDNEFVWFLKELWEQFKDNPNYSVHYDSVAREFYSCVRCALLHDACTRNNWIIRKDSKRELIFDNSNREEKILYRNNFYKRIYDFVMIDMKSKFDKNDSYVTSLGLVENFRKNLLKKTDVIFETANYSKEEEIPFWWD